MGGIDGLDLRVFFGLSNNDCDTLTIEQNSCFQTMTFVITGCVRSDGTTAGGWWKTTCGFIWFEPALPSTAESRLSVRATTTVEAETRDRDNIDSRGEMTLPAGITYCTINAADSAEASSFLSLASAYPPSTQAEAQYICLSPGHSTTHLSAIHTLATIFCRDSDKAQVSKVNQEVILILRRMFD